MENSTMLKNVYAHFITIYSETNLPITYLKYPHNGTVFQVIFDKMQFSVYLIIAWCHPTSLFSYIVDIAKMDVC